MSHSEINNGIKLFFSDNGIINMIRWCFKDNQTIVTTRFNQFCEAEPEMNKTIMISCGVHYIILIDNDGKITSNQVVEKISDVSLSYINYDVESIHLIGDVNKLLVLLHELGYTLFQWGTREYDENKDEEDIEDDDESISLWSLFNDQTDKFAVINKGDEFEVNVIRKDGDNCDNYALECQLNDIRDDLERDTNMTEIVNIIKNNIDNIYAWSHEPHVMYILTKKDVVLF